MPQMLKMPIKRIPIKKKPVDENYKSINCNSVEKITVPDENDEEGMDKVKDMINKMCDCLEGETYTKARKKQTIPKLQIDEVYNKFMNDLLISIRTTIGTKHVKMGVVVRNFEEDDIARHWNKINQSSTHHSICL